jgi:hypothetical protein
MTHHRCFRILTLTCTLWLGPELHGDGLYGVTAADALNDTQNDHVQDCASCSLSQLPEFVPPNTPFELPTVIPPIPIPSLEAIMQTSIRLASCADRAVQHSARRGPSRQTLVFIDRTAAGLADVPTTPRAMAVCVGCHLDDLRQLQERFPDVPLHLAPSGLMRELGVSCVPTIVEVSPTVIPEEVP